MGSTPVCTIDAAGIHVPDFASVIAYFQNGFKGIFGQDIYIENDSQDGQQLGLLATAVSDANSMCVAAYNAYSPATAQGTGLSSVVKTNGIARKVPTYSTCDLVLIGQANTVITNGYAVDINSVQWNLPASVTIPQTGQITVTATCSAIGATNAGVGTITTIGTPTAGWQSVANAMAAVPGAPVETDPQLKARQTVSTAIPSTTILDGIVGAISAIPNVLRIKAYENATNLADKKGIPGHMIALVVDGGDAATIASVIAAKKSPGGGTYGSVSQTVVSPQGIPRQVNFFRPAAHQITYTLTIRALAGFTPDVQAQVQQTLSDWTNGLGIGGSVQIGRAFMPAQLYGAAASSTYELLTIAAARDGNGTVQADVAILFNEAPVCSPSNIAFVVAQ